VQKEVLVAKRKKGNEVHHKERHTDKIARHPVWPFMTDHPLLVTCPRAMFLRRRGISVDY